MGTLPHSGPRSSHAHSDEDDYSRRLDNRLFMVVSSILGVLALLCIAGLAIQISVYSTELNLVKAAEEKLTFARALDAAILKTSGLFLGYLLIFTGALYVLRIATSHFRLSLKSGAHSGSFQTSSPGLAMITLGVFLVAIAILHTTTISLSSSRPEATDQAGGHSVELSTKTEPPPEKDGK